MRPRSAAVQTRRPVILVAVVSLMALLAFAASPVTAGAQEQCTAPLWSSSEVYVGGDQVTHDGHTWEANWWTQGEEPGVTASGVWNDLGPCEGDPDPPDAGPCIHPAWDAATVYLGGDRVTHDGHTWLAKWWTQGEEPGVTTSGVWGDEGVCGDDEPPPDEPPDPPTGLTVTATTDSTVSLDWDDAAGADDYLVFRDGNQVGTPASSNFIDSGLSPSTQYSYTVQARNAHGTSGTSDRSPRRPMTISRPGSSSTGASATSRSGASTAATSWSTTSC